MGHDTERQGVRRRTAALAATMLALAAIGPAAATAAPVAPVGPARMTILYDLDTPARAIVRPSGGQAGVGAARGAFRQEGSTGHLFGGARDARSRIGKVSGAALAGMSAPAMAAALRSQIVRGCVVNGRNYGCRSDLVAIDEVGVAFRGAAGARLSAAMQTLATEHARDGESLARRLHVYLAPALVTSIGARGQSARGGTWAPLMAALAQAGGVWLEMYHGGRVEVQAFSASEWRRAPSAVARALARAGGDVGRLHFMLSATGMPAGRVPAGCATPMSCTWALADLRGVNRRILTAGPGAYRVGDQAAAWLAGYNRYLPAGDGPGSGGATRSPSAGGSDSPRA